MSYWSSDLCPSDLTALEIGIPSQEEIQEIEASSRLYQQNGALYMKASVLVKTDTWRPESTAITFILAGKRLVTVRYDKPRFFSIFASRAQHAGSSAEARVGKGWCQRGIKRR